MDPWSFTAEDMRSYGLPYNDGFWAARASAADAREYVQSLVDQGGGSIWDSKYEDLRTSYQEYIRTLCDTNDTFAAFWNTYAGQQGALQATGRYETEGWKQWFDALAQRDYLVEQTIPSGVQHERPGQQVQELVAALWDYASSSSRVPGLRSEFPLFARSSGTGKALVDG
jgi:hypothetical protein